MYGEVFFAVHNHQSYRIDYTACIDSSSILLRKNPAKQFIACCGISFVSFCMTSTAVSVVITHISSPIFPLYLLSRIAFPAEALSSLIIQRFHDFRLDLLIRIILWKISAEFASGNLYDGALVRFFFLHQKKDIFFRKCPFL